MIKDIKGFKGLYQITDTGIVKALERKILMPKGGDKIIKEHFPKLSITRKGYLKVMLTNKNKIRKGFFVHRLVALNFIEYNKLQVNHKDGNKKNNKVGNLEFVTNKENINHRFKSVVKSSIYAGVTWHKGNKKWQCQKMINGKRTYLGLFKTQIEARDKYLES